MSTFLVTGGAGGVGSHLVEHLIKNGDKVIVIDKLIYQGQSEKIKKQLLEKYPQVGFYDIDLVDKEAVLDFFINHSVDGVFHLAALPSHRISLSYPFEYFQNDLQATVNILESIRKVCPKVPLLFTSTNKVYSDDEIVVSEKSKLDPRGPYAIAKIQSEQWCEFYQSKFGLKLSTVRLFHVVGSRMQPNREIPVFLKSILDGRPIHLHGKFLPDGSFLSAYFGYTNVADTVNGMIICMNELCRSGKYEVFNIGIDEKFLVGDILKLISERLGKTVQVVNTPLMEHESMGCVADSTKLQKLGWKTQNTVEKAVLDYVDWYLGLGQSDDKLPKKMSGILF